MYSEYMHITWFKEPDSVSNHLDGEIYDMVVAGNLVDRRISLWGKKESAARMVIPTKELICGVEQSRSLLVLL